MIKILAFCPISQKDDEHFRHFILKLPPPPTPSPHQTFNWCKERRGKLGMNRSQ